MYLLNISIDRFFAGQRRSKTSGFTMVELIVVMAIILILAALIAYASGTIIKQAKRAGAQNLANQIQTATTAFYTEYSVYPYSSGIGAANTDLVIGDSLAADAQKWTYLLLALDGNINPTTGVPVVSPTSPQISTNTRNIAFMSMKLSDLTIAGATYAPKNPLPTSATAALYFNIAIDYDGDGVLGVAPSAVVTMPKFSPTFSSAGGGVTTSGVAVWVNCNGNAGVNPNYYPHTY